MADEEKNIALLCQKFQDVKFDLDGTGYKAVETIGSGTYGVVCSAVQCSTGRRVAIKKIPNIFESCVLAKRTCRELKILRYFNHENIIRILDVLKLKEDEASFRDVYLVMDLMETDLYQIIRSKQVLTDDHIRYFIYQIACGLKYIHSANVIHRDLKPSNLLVNGNCSLKIADFGMARCISSNEGDRNSLMTWYVATRWYRAPELMLFKQKYTGAVDIWSVGCILAELLGRQPIFPGRNFTNQIQLIFGILGSPNEDFVQQAHADRIKEFVRSFGHKDPVPLKHLYSSSHPKAIRLLEKMLKLNPRERISAADILTDLYLNQYHDPNAEPGCPHPFNFDLDEQTLDSCSLRWCIYDEIMKSDNIASPANDAGLSNSTEQSTTSYGQPTTSCGQPTTSCGQPTTSCDQPMTSCDLPTTSCGLELTSPDFKVLQLHKSKDLHKQLINSAVPNVASIVPDVASSVPNVASVQLHSPMQINPSVTERTIPDSLANVEKPELRQENHVMPLPLSDNPSQSLFNCSLQPDCHGELSLLSKKTVSSDFQSSQATALQDFGSKSMASEMPIVKSQSNRKSAFKSDAKNSKKATSTKDSGHNTVVKKSNRRPRKEFKSVNSVSLFNEQGERINVKAVLKNAILNGHQTVEAARRTSQLPVGNKVPTKTDQSEVKLSEEDKILLRRWSEMQKAKLPISSETAHNEKSENCAPDALSTQATIRPPALPAMNLLSGVSALEKAQATGPLISPNMFNIGDKSSDVMAWSPSVQLSSGDICSVLNMKNEASGDIQPDNNCNLQDGYSVNVLNPVNLKNCSSVGTLQTFLPQDSSKCDQQLRNTKQCFFDYNVDSLHKKCSPTAIYAGNIPLDTSNNSVANSLEVCSTLGVSSFSGYSNEALRMLLIDSSSTNRKTSSAENCGMEYLSPLLSPGKLSASSYGVGMDVEMILPDEFSTLTCGLEGPRTSNSLLSSWLTEPVVTADLEDVLNIISDM